MNLQEKRQQTYKCISAGKFKKASPERVSSLLFCKYLRKPKNVEISQIIQNTNSNWKPVIEEESRLKK